MCLPEDAWQENLGAVADGVDGAVFHDDALVSGEEGLLGPDDAPQVGLVLVVVVQPLGVQHVVQRAHPGVVLVLDAGTDATKLLERRQVVRLVFLISKQNNCKTLN